MKVNNYKKNRLAAAITCALMPIVLSATAIADEESAAKKAKKEKQAMEVIEVTTFKDSIVSALNNKRGANSISDGITADDVGSFPDDNIAESLQRIPGVSITRSLGGEGEAISIRGFAPGQNLTLFNGNQVSTASFGLENATNRGVSFVNFPSTMIKRSVVYKSSQAKHPIGGVGGVADTITRKPLNQKQDFAFVAKLKTNYNDLSEQTSPSYSSSASWKIDDKLGVLIAVDGVDRKNLREAVEVLGYTKATFDTESGKSFSGVYVPGAVGFASFEQENKRETISTTVQYQPTDSLDFNLYYQRSDRDGSNLNTNFITRDNTFFDKKTGYTPKNGVTILDAVLPEGSDTIESITYAAIDESTKNIDNIWISPIRRNAKIFNEYYSIDGSWIGDNLTVKAAAGVSNAEGGAGEQFFSRLGIDVQTTVSIADGIGFMELPDDFDPANLTTPTAKLANAAGNRKEVESTNDFYSVDFEYFFDDSVFTSVEFGARQVNATMSRVQTNYILDWAKLGEHPKLNELPFELFDLYDRENSLDNITDKAITDYQYLDPKSLEPFGISYAERVNHANSSHIDETINSVYVQANFEKDFDSFILRGNFGLRNSEQEADISVFSSQLKPGNLFEGQNNYEKKNFEDRLTINRLDYDFVEKGKTNVTLPSLNLIADVGDKWVFRFAASTVVSRPSYDQLAKQLVVSSLSDEEIAERILNGEDGAVNKKARKGNPDLEPFEANKYGLSSEWYYDEGSNVSLGAFYYDIQTFVLNEVTDQELRPGEIWAVTQPVNESGGSIKGIEFAVTHQFNDWLPGFGVNLNVTALEEETPAKNAVTGETIPLPGFSDLTYNLGAFYSKNGWNARLSYNYRSEFYRSSFGDDLELNRVVDDIKRLNFQLKYRINKNWAVAISGNNLTDETQTIYVNNKNRPYQSSQYGRNFGLAIDYKL